MTELHKLTHTSDGVRGGLVAVLGGTGKSGRRVAERLVRQGIPIRTGSRTSAPPFDWNDQATWRQVLDGVAACYLAYYPDLAFPGAVDTVGALAKQAAAAGVDRLVLLSGRGEPEAQRAEEAVANSGCSWTVVRSAWFAQNFSEHFMLPAVLEGRIVLPTGGDVAEPFVDLDDVAAVAVEALTGSGHDGRIYEVTGPRLLTFGDVAEELSRATGRSIQFESVPVEAFKAEAIRGGVPEREVEDLVHLFSEVLDGHNAYLTDGVEQCLGRAPRDFAQYAKDAAASGVWALGGS